MPSLPALPVLSLLLLSACAPAASPAPPSTAAGRPEVVEYWTGTSEVFAEPSPAGASPLARQQVLLQRVVEPGQSRIVERVVSEGRRGRPATEFVVVQAVTGASFTMTERGGAFTGSGTLDGPAWGWTSWTSRSVLPDGTSVESQDRLTGEGLEVEKVIRGARGTMRLREHFSRIDLAAYAQQRAALGVAPLAPEEARPATARER